MSSTEKSRRDSQEGRTLAYYERNAERYFRITHDANLSTIYQSFVHRVPKGGRILDAGSGSGRDTLAFIQKGYTVEAFDSSPALCRLSTKFTGVQASVRRFQEVEGEEEFAGVWACASLLHVPEAELGEAIGRLVQALKTGGVLYMSFKYGTSERVAEDGRLFVDMTEDRLRGVLQGVQDSKVERVWRTFGEGKFEGQDEWLNVLVSKRRKLKDT